MKIQQLTIGQSVRHPQYGVGVVKSLNEQTVDVRFDDATRTVDPVLGELTPAEASVAVSGLDMPLKQFMEDSVEAVLHRIGYESPEVVVGGLGTRWHGGRMVLHPADAKLQTKEVPLEVFFHKLVGVRNQLRILEQKINAHPTLSDGEKVEVQQYITRCYGSLTTFNLLFKEKEDQF